MSDPHRVSDQAVLTSIVETLRSQIVPALNDAWTRSAAIQLAALAQMLRDRPSDRAAERAGELAALLTELDAPADAWSYDAVLGACSAALASWPEDDERRHRLRAVLIRHLDEDLTVNMPLLAAFRGQLPDA
jgi:hypothetical protein